MPMALCLMFPDLAKSHQGESVYCLCHSTTGPRGGGGGGGGHMTEGGAGGWMCPDESICRFHTASDAAHPGKISSSRLCCLLMRRHLSSVQPVDVQPSGTLVTVAAADVAVKLLTSRFAQPGSTGTEELVLLHAGLPSSTHQIPQKQQDAVAHSRSQPQISNSLEAPANGISTCHAACHQHEDASKSAQQEGAQAPDQEHLSCSSDDTLPNGHATGSHSSFNDVESRKQASAAGRFRGSGEWVQHASMLVALPDVCGASNVPLMRPKTFVLHLLQQLLAALALIQSTPGERPTP